MWSKSRTRTSAGPGGVDSCRSEGGEGKCLGRKVNELGHGEACLMSSSQWEKSWRRERAENEVTVLTESSCVALGKMDSVRQW